MKNKAIVITMLLLTALVLVIGGTVIYKVTRADEEFPQEETSSTVTDSEVDVTQSPEPQPETNPEPEISTEPENTEEPADISDSAKYEGKITDSVSLDVPEYWDFNFMEADWYSVPENMNFQENVYQFIGYAVYLYYGNAPAGTWSVDINNDVYHTLTNMVFGVVVHGETKDLDLVVDMEHDVVKVVEIPKDGEPSAAYELDSVD